MKDPRARPAPRMLIVYRAIDQLKPDPNNARRQLDPAYVDTLVRRWQALTSGNARHAVSGRNSDDLVREAEAAGAV